MSIARRQIWRTITAALGIIAALIYLRDPPWVLTMTSGMRPWETDSTGRRIRWMGGHASFFVPADARSIVIPLRTTFDRSDDWPITVTVSIDDRSADRLRLTDGRWRQITLTMPARGSRRARRIDLTMDRTRDDNRSAAIGDVIIR